MLPTKNQVLENFSICNNWEEKYMYIIDLGKLLSKLPNDLKTPKYLVTGCQNNTWIALVPAVLEKKINNNNFIKFYGDSDSAIIKGIIVIIFSLYNELNTSSIINFDAKSILNKLQLNQNLTISRLQGVYSILYSIKNQSNNLLNKK